MLDLVMAERVRLYRANILSGLVHENPTVEMEI